MVVNACELERDTHVLAKRLEQALHVLLDGVQTVHFLLVCCEMVLVDLVDENFVSDVLLDCVAGEDQVSETHTRGLVVLQGLCVDHVDERSAIRDQVCSVSFEYVVSGEIKHLKLDVRVVVHFLPLYLRGWQQKEGLVGAHLLEHDFLN